MNNAALQSQTPTPYTYANTYGGYDVIFNGEVVTSFTTSSALSDAKGYCERANERLAVEAAA